MTEVKVATFFCQSPLKISTMFTLISEENSKKILSLRDRLSQLKSIPKMKSSENNGEAGTMQEQLKTAMKEVGQNTTAVSEHK